MSFFGLGKEMRQSGICDKSFKTKKIDTKKRDSQICWCCVKPPELACDLFIIFIVAWIFFPLFFIFCFNECLPFSLIFLPSLCVCSYICFGFAQSEIHIFFPILIDGLSSMFVDYNQLADIFRHIFNLMAKLVAPLLAWHKVREFKSSQYAAGRAPI